MRLFRNIYFGAMIALTLYITHLMVVELDIILDIPIIVLYVLCFLAYIMTFNVFLILRYFLLKMLGYQMLSRQFAKKKVENGEKQKTPFRLLFSYEATFPNGLDATSFARFVKKEKIANQIMFFLYIIFIFLLYIASSPFKEIQQILFYYLLLCIGYILGIIILPVLFDFASHKRKATLSKTNYIYYQLDEFKQKNKEDVMFKEIYPEYASLFKEHRFQSFDIDYYPLVFAILKENDDEIRSILDYYQVHNKMEFDEELKFYAINQIYGVIWKEEQRITLPKQRMFNYLKSSRTQWSRLAMYAYYHYSKEDVEARTLLYIIKKEFCKKDLLQFQPLMERIESK